MDTSQNLYSQTTFQIFIKNFLAGFARGLGSLSLYVLTLFISYQYIIKPKLGDITEFLDLYKDSMVSFKQIQTLPSQTDQPNTDINGLLEQLQILNQPTQ
jgi:hypothetical protein